MKKITCMRLVGLVGLASCSLVACVVDGTSTEEDVASNTEPFIFRWQQFGSQEGGYSTLRGLDTTDNGVDNRVTLTTKSTCYTAANKTVPAAGYDFRATMSGSSGAAWAGVPWKGTYEIPVFWAGDAFDGTATFNVLPKQGATSGSTCKGTLTYHVDVAESMRARANYKGWVWMAWGVFNGAFADNFIENQEAGFGVSSQQTIPASISGHCDDAEMDNIQGDASNRTRVPYISGELWAKLCTSRTSATDCRVERVAHGSDMPGSWQVDPWNNDYDGNGSPDQYCNAERAFTWTRRTSGYQYVWSLDLVSTAGHGDWGAPVEAMVWSCPSGNTGC